MKTLARLNGARADIDNSLSKKAASSPSATGAPTFFQGPSGAPPAAAVLQSYDQAVTVGPSGKLQAIMTMALAIGGSGTTTAGENMKFQARLDSGVVPGFVVEQSMGTDGVVSATVLFNATGLAAGSTHDIGIQATNGTTPTHTFIFDTNTLGVQGFYWAL